MLKPDLKNVLPNPGFLSPPAPPPIGSDVVDRGRLVAWDADDENRWAARRRWGRAVDAGFTIIPDVLIRAQTLLGLDTVDLAILLNIIMPWWERDDLPYPRPSLIAKRIGVTPRTVQRRLIKLQESGLIKRMAAQRAKGNLSVRKFDLTGLVVRLEGLAERNLQDRQNPPNRNQLQLPASHGAPEEFAGTKGEAQGE